MQPVLTMLTCGPSQAVPGIQIPTSTAHGAVTAAERLL